MKPVIENKENGRGRKTKRGRREKSAGTMLRGAEERYYYDATPLTIES